MRAKTIKLTPADEKRVVTGLIILTILCMGILDLYIPSLPAITKSFNTSASFVQFSFTACLIIYAITSLIVGPLSDIYGRRTFLLSGLLIGIGGGLICLYCETIYQFIGGRIIQGIGYGMSALAARATIRDISSGLKMIKLSSIIVAIGAIVVGTAPILGGLIEQYYHWRMSFVVILGGTFISLCYCWFYLPETNQHQIENKKKGLSTVINDYLTPLRDSQFWGYNLCGGIASSGLMCFAFIIPFIFINDFHLPPSHYGFYVLAMAVAYMISILCNPTIVKKLGSQTSIMTGLGVMLSGGLLLCLYSMLGLHSPWQVIIPSIIFVIGTSFIYPSITAAILAPYGKIAGIVSAISGSIQVIFAFFIPFFIVFIPNNQSPMVLGFVYCILPSMSFIAIYSMVFRKGPINIEPSLDTVD